MSKRAQAVSEWALALILACTACGCVFLTGGIAAGIYFAITH